jgi:transcriptional regulator with XRE-family HTH domain
MISRTFGSSSTVEVSGITASGKGATMVLLRQLLGDVLRRLRLRQGRTLREVSASARVSLGYLSEVERGQKEASSELLAAICGALNTPLSQVFREVSDNFALAELQNEPVLGVPREPGLRVPAEASVGLDGERGFVQISTMVPDQEFADGQAGFGTASGHVHDVTDMVSVLSRGCSDPGARIFRQEPDHVRQGP